MTQQTSGYEQDHAQSTAETAKDRLRDMAEATAGKVKEMAGAPRRWPEKSRTRRANTARRRRKP
jgi:hypothetical protein